MANCLTVEIFIALKTYKDGSLKPSPYFVLTLRVCAFMSGLSIILAAPRAMQRKRASVQIRMVPSTVPS